MTREGRRRTPIAFAALHTSAEDKPLALDYFFAIFLLLTINLSIVCYFWKNIGKKLKKLVGNESFGYEVAIINVAIINVAIINVAIINVAIIHVAIVQ